MKYVSSFRPDRPVVLDEGVTRESVAAECREAALSLMAVAASDAPKLDLAIWLTGPYARATRHFKRGERTPTRAFAIDPAEIDALLEATRADVLAMLSTDPLAPGALEFAHDAVNRALVRRVSDENLESVWVPIDGPRMRLRDRVISLFAAHRLNDPATHAELFICPECSSVVFDEHAREVGRCAAHRHGSGIEFRKKDGIWAVAVGEDE